MSSRHPAAPSPAPANLDRTLAALADPMRRGAIELLRKRPRRAGELASALAVSAPRMSQHLRILRDSGLIDCLVAPRDARARIYRLRSEPLTELSGWLAETEALWASELAAFKAHAERTRRRRP